LRGRSLTNLGRRLTSSAVAAVVLAWLRGAGLRLAATALRTCAAGVTLAASATGTLGRGTAVTLARTASAVTLASTASAVASLLLAATAALLLTAAAVTAGPALALGCAVRRVHERGRQRHSRG
jgi:hypothetical protein